MTTPTEIAVRKLIESPAGKKMIQDAERQESERPAAAIKRLRRELVDCERAHEGRIAEVTAQLGTTGQEADAFLAEQVSRSRLAELLEVNTADVDREIKHFRGEEAGRDVSFVMPR